MRRRPDPSRLVAGRSIEGANTIWRGAATHKNSAPAGVKPGRGTHSKINNSPERSFTMPDLTTEQVAEELSTTAQRVRRMRRQGRFPGAWNLGTTAKPEWRIPARDLDRLRRQGVAA